MSGLETAIRNALENSDRDNPEVRGRIYKSARQALEAGLRKQ
ncbi:regulator, partial [Rhizobium ruizarguesonis]